ncbi:glycoside hydrolase [Cohnella terricola]|uniref:Glycoside hydrolase n=2 Tax=Cohnella terricola TaxID=1289167 RepID=A0A559J660_9BACL|nr:glycoside hydrolase [Cohnella terricola]
MSDAGHRADAAPVYPFDDVTPNFASEAILHLSQLHIIGGTGQRRFEPLKATTRAEFVAMLDRLFGLSPVAGAVPAFKDVPRESWFYPWAQAGVATGIAQGTTSRTFEPNRKITRQEAAVLMTRALKQEPASSAHPRYKDEDSIASWAMPYVKRLSELALIEGDTSGNFRPDAPLTRQEAAVILDRVLTRDDWASQIRSTPAAKIQLGWQYDQTTAQFEKQVESSAVNTLSPRWFFLEKSSSLTDLGDRSLVSWAHNRGKKVWAMIGNHSDQTLTHQMLSSSEQRKTFITNLLNAVQKYGVDGLNLDFENVAPGDRSGLTQFVSELSIALHAKGTTLSVNVSPDLGTDWTDAFDYAALGKYADYIVLMGYDEHWDGSPIAGSVSSQIWLQSGLQKLLLRVPANKTILALPFYTRDWYANAFGMQSIELSLIQQNSVLQSRVSKMAWNDALSQYEAEYVASGVRHRIWVEDGRSIASKIRMAENYAIAGYAYWYIGGESRDIWDSVRNELKFDSYRFSS